MSHAIMERDSLASHQKEWHWAETQHTVIDAAIPIGAENCGICYPMVLQPTYLQTQEFTKDDNGLIIPGSNFRPDGAFRVVCLDDNLPVGGHVGKGYKIVDNCAMIAMCLKVCQEHGATIESVGTVQNREIGHCSLSVQASVIIADQPVQCYLNFIWGHGGTKGIIVRVTLVKTVCLNTIQLSLQAYSDYESFARHTAGSLAQMGDVSKTFAAYKAAIVDYKAQVEKLALVKCTAERARQIFAGFIVPQGDVTEIGTKTSNIIEELVLLFNTGKGNSGKTMEDVLNAFTDYYTHASAGEDKWKQFQSSEFGSGLTKKLTAYQMLTGQKVKNLGSLTEVSLRGKKLIKLL